MSTIFLAAFALQWVALVALGILIVALMRQVGMLHERLGPVGALTLPGGPGVGESAPQFTLPSLTGGSVTIGGSTTDGKSMLLFFLSPDCPVCKSLLPVLREIASASRPYLKLIFASDGDEPRKQR